MPKKKDKRKTIAIGGVVFALLFAGAGAGIVDRDTDTKCGGEERWDEKVLVDDAVDDVNADPAQTTIEALNAISTQEISIKHDTKRQAIEKQVYTVRDCFITRAILEADDDIHLVIEDGRGGHMIAEIPDPKCPDAKKSQFVRDFRQARKEFLRYQNVYNHYRFDITGVLFIDKKHAKNPTGNAANNIELHPVLRLEHTSQY